MCNALDSDLKNFTRYEEEFQLGHKLGGKFAEIGRAVANKELLGKIPKEIVLPHHEKYNLPQKRMDRLERIINDNIKTMEV